MISQLLVGIVTGIVIAGIVSIVALLNLWLAKKGSAKKEFSAGISPSIKDDALVDTIDRLLPQTQCGECSYTGCKPYAQAITQGVADINQCPPGGPETIVQLSELLGREVVPLNPVHGEHRPFRLAVIDEEQCIGCTKCIQACPVDAIVGAAKLMHTVIVDHCTGCELCIPPCPVDCIDMLPVHGQKQAIDFGCHEKVA